MTRSVTIRDVPDDTHSELAARAALSGRSLQEYLRVQLVELARRPDAEALLAQIRQRKARPAVPFPPRAHCAIGTRIAIDAGCSEKATAESGVLELHQKNRPVPRKGTGRSIFLM